MLWTCELSEFDDTDGCEYFAFYVNGDLDVTDDTYGTDDTD